MENLNNDIASKSKEVIEAEEKYLKIGDNKTGIAISGGGIRSASFGLGVIQALVSKDRLKEMDYMSTVSGGGFVGSALTWALNQGKTLGDEALGPDKFPLGNKKASGRVKPERNKLLDFIRQHGDYLTPTSGLGLISFIAVIVRSILLSLLVYGSLLTLLMTLAIWGEILYPEGNDIGLGIGSYKGYAVPVGLILFSVYVLFSFIYSLFTFIGGRARMRFKYLGFIQGQRFIGLLWQLGLASLLIGTLPYIIEWADRLNAMIVACGSTVFGSIVGALQYAKAQKEDKSTSAGSDIFIYLGAFALIYGLLLLTYLLAGDHLMNEGEVLWNYFLVLFGVLLVFGIFTNLNLNGPHRVWRDRLMEAYMPGKEAVEKNMWEPAKAADGALMEEMCDQDNPKPYHILNTNIILVDSDQTKFRKRGGDNFIISRLFCGSDATCWRTTDTFQKRGGRGITLATAMATSSAAVNPNAGVSGEGATRNSVVSLLLSILNLRLGYWTTNPKKTPLPFPPNFFFPALRSEILPLGLSEQRTNIQLSDGGHFENLALYELIRRKLKLIVLSDGSQDSKFNFDDLANATEKARVDFGAQIEFSDEFGLSHLLPNSAGDSQYIEKYGIAKRGYAVAKITYEDNTQGILIYIKLTVVNDLPTDVYSYKGVNPDFPHQSTADQFFDEKQFEAYRELGYNIGKQMIMAEEKKLWG